MKNKRVKDSAVGIQISKPTNIILNIIFIIIAMACLYPLLLMFAVSLTDESTLATNGYSILSTKLSLTAYSSLLENIGVIIQAYGVSLFVTLVGSIMGLLIMALYAYPLSRDDFKYKHVFKVIIAITILFSGGLAPMYMVYVKVIHFKNSLSALILLHLFNAFYVMIICTFYKTNISKSLIEATQIDGAGEFLIFFKIVIPLAKPALATIMMFSMLVYWNDWYGPLLFIRDEKLYNLQYLLYYYMSRSGITLSIVADTSVNDFPLQTTRMALAIVTIAPVIIACPFFQRYFEKGLYLGAIKE